MSQKMTVGKIEQLNTEKTPATAVIEMLRGVDEAKVIVVDMQCELTALRERLKKAEALLERVVGYIPNGSTGMAGYVRSIKLHDDIAAFLAEGKEKQ